MRANALHRPRKSRLKNELLHITTYHNAVATDLPLC